MNAPDQNLESESGRPQEAPRRYSAEWVKAEADRISAHRLDHHECSICGHMVRYLISGDRVGFQSACHCAWAAVRDSSFEEIAEWLAMQSQDEIRDRIMLGLHGASRSVHDEEERLTKEAPINTTKKGGAG